VYVSWPYLEGIRLLTREQQLMFDGNALSFLQLEAQSDERRLGVRRERDLLLVLAAV
jgi:hypothetical protein